VRQVFGDLIDQLTEEWGKAMHTADRGAWVKATDEFRARVCDLLTNATQLNGSTLPDDLREL
jgi:hypothetical protein